MEAAAHHAGGFGGVPQSVGKDFAAADHARGKKKLPERVGEKLGTDHGFGVRHGVHAPIKK